MKKVIITLVSSLVMMAITNTMSAQTTEGTITMEITEVSSDNAQMAQVAEMMKGTKTEVYFKGDKSAVRMNMMGGMVKMEMHTEKDKDFNMLMDAMGQKIWVNTPQNELAQMKAEAPEMEITFDKSDTKEIAGYQCYRMDVVVDGDTEMNITAYITEDLKIDAPVMQGVDMSKFPGYPLEYSMSGGPMSMTITTQEFLKTVDASVFDYSTDGYQKMSMEDLQGMGGGGFGF